VDYHGIARKKKKRKVKTNEIELHSEIELETGRVRRIQAVF